jgi:hypothetical protein
MIRILHRPGRTVSGLLLFLGAVLATGCGGRSGTVKGKISVGGVPLKRGLITFLSQVGNKDAYSAAVIDGNYETDPIPTGTCRIVVIHAQLPPEAAAKGNDLVPVRKRGERRQEVPAQFHDPDTSGLSIDVGPGTNTFDKDL